MRGEGETVRGVQKGQAMSKKLQWTVERCDQLAELRELVREAGSINRGNMVIERLARCIELAERLNGRDGFLAFLDDLAIAEREARKGARG